MDYFSTISMSSIFIQFIYWYKFRTAVAILLTSLTWIEKGLHGLWHLTQVFSASQLLVAQSCLTLCDPMTYILPGSSVHGILQARILEWVAMPSSRGSSWNQSSPPAPYCRQILYHLSQKGRPLHHSPNAKICKTS